MGISTVQTIVCGVANAIWDEMMPEYMAPPATQHQWSAIASGFQKRWQFPYCCGAIDGKYCIIQALPKSGSLFWNYKKIFSVVLLGLVDSRYCFIMVDVGACSSEGNSNTFCNSTFGQ